MVVTSFGIVWIIILIVAFIRGTNVTLKCLLFSSLFQAGAVFIIAEDKPLSPLLVSAVVYICSCIIHYRKIVLKIPSFLAILLIWVLVSMISSFFAPIFFRGITYMECVDWEQYNRYDGHIALWGLCVLLIYIICGVFVYNYARLEKNEIDRMISFMIIFVFGVGVWHMLSAKHYIPNNEFIANFIFSNTTRKENISYFIDIDISKRIYSSIFGIRFCGCFMEPSYCGGFLAMSFAYFVSKMRLNKKDCGLLLLILLMTIQTFSATAYAAVAFAGILSLLVSGKKRYLTIIAERGILVVMASLAGMTCFGLWGAVERLIINKSSTHSAYIRGLWNINAIQTFFDTYGIGLGYSNARGSSLLCTLPASLGLTGTVLFGFFVVSLLLYRNINMNEDDVEQRRFKLMFATVLTAMFVAISVLDYSIFWMSFYLCIMTKKNKVNKEFYIFEKNKKAFEIGGTK